MAEADGIGPGLPWAEVGEPYSVQLGASRGDTALNQVRWEVAEPDTLPSFLSLDPATGVLSGTPIERGVFPFTVLLLLAADSSYISEQYFALAVRPGVEARLGASLYIETPSPLPLATLGEDYSIEFAASNAEGPIKWSSSNVPNGLALDSLTGVLDGRPEASGHFCVSVTVSEQGESSRLDTKVFSLTTATRESGAEQLNAVDATLARLTCGDLAFTAPEVMRLDETQELTLAVSLDRTVADLRRLLLGTQDLEPLVRDLERQGAPTEGLQESIEEVDRVASEPSADSVDRREAIEEVREELDELATQGFDIEDIESELPDIEDVVIRSTVIGASVRFADRMSAQLTGEGFEIVPLSPVRQGVSRLEVTEWTWRVRALEPRTQELRLALSAVLQLEGSPELREIQTFVREIEVSVSWLARAAQFHGTYWQWIWGIALIALVLTTPYSRTRLLAVVAGTPSNPRGPPDPRLSWNRGPSTNNQKNSAREDLKSMRILFLAANPTATTALDLEEELRSLETELRGTTYRDQVVLTARHAVRPDDLIRHVRSERPNVIHFSGHGSQRGIVLRNDDGGYTEVSGPSLKRFFAGRGVELVVLNACFTKTQAENLPGSVKAVIGTTDAVGDVAARRFTVAFYRALGEGLSIGEAFRDGGDAVALDNRDDVFWSGGELHGVLVDLI